MHAQIKAQTVHNQAQRKAFLGSLRFRDRVLMAALKVLGRRPIPRFLMPSAATDARWSHSFFDFSANPYFRHAFARLIFTDDARGQTTRGIAWIDERRNKIDQRARAYFDLGVGSGRALVGEMARWARERGMAELCGPWSLREWASFASLPDAEVEGLQAALQKIGPTERRRKICFDWHPLRAISEEESLQLEKKKVVGELRFVDFDPLTASPTQLQSALRVLAEAGATSFFDEDEWRFVLGVENRVGLSQLSFTVEADCRVVATCWAYVGVDGVVRTLWSECLPELRLSGGAHGTEHWMDLELMRRAKSRGYAKVCTPWIDEADERQIERFESLGATFANETSFFVTRLV